MNGIAKTEGQRINDLHMEATSHAIRAVEAAAECGRALLGVKAKLNHGEWLPWLKTNVVFSDRTARAYMRVAKDPNRQRVANLPLREAIKELSQMSNEKLIEETYRAIRQREIETLRAQQFERMAEALRREGFIQVESQELLQRPILAREGKTRPVLRMVGHTEFLLFGIRVA